jgi:hypothetical protein
LKTSALGTFAATAEPKSYSADELSAVLAQLQDSNGRKLSVMAGSDLFGSIEQGKALIASMDVQPAECREMAASNGVTAVDGAVMAVGQSLDAAAGSMTILHAQVRSWTQRRPSSNRSPVRYRCTFGAMSRTTSSGSADASGSSRTT